MKKIKLKKVLFVMGFLLLLGGFSCLKMPDSSIPSLNIYGDKKHDASNGGNTGNSSTSGSTSTPSPTTSGNTGNTSTSSASNTTSPSTQAMITVDDLEGFWISRAGWAYQFEKNGSTNRMDGHFFKCKENSGGSEDVTIQVDRVSAGGMRWDVISTTQLKNHMTHDPLNHITNTSAKDVQAFCKEQGY